MILSNLCKTKKELNRTYTKAKNQKNDNYHKITKELSKKFDLIVVEDLKTKKYDRKRWFSKKRTKQVNSSNFILSICPIFGL